MHIFISHSSKDAAVALKICELLEKNGKSCFIAPRDIRSGREYAEEIVNGIDQSEAMVLVMSANANQSPHVLREVERAVSKSIPILVYKLEEVELSKSMEYFLMTHQWVNAVAGDDYSDILDFVCNLKSAADGTTAHNAPSDRKKRRNILLVAAGMLLVVLLAFGGYQFVSNRDTGKEICTLQVGDTVTFGSYNGEAIAWRVLQISEDGTEAVLIAKNILTMKAFDAAESGKYNYDGTTDYWSQDSPADTDMELQASVRGNNDWSVSNIRTWLNSADEVVAYADQPPVSTAMAERKNGYQNEPGFLYGFTEEELAAILETEVVTTGNVLADSATITTTDKVYLLSMEEMQWFEDAGISKLAVPTQAAIEHDKSNWYMIDVDIYDIEEYCWWLREPVEGTASKCYLVGNGYTEDNIQEENVGLEGYGIRPAITVSLESDIFQTEE